METFKSQLLKAQNVFLDENTGGKGKYFKARFLQPGLVKYSFGVCLLEKETIDKFIFQFVGCPVIIGHQDVTNENAQLLSAGNICHIWYDNQDGWYWGDGIIDNEDALSKIKEGYNVSCQYEITEYSNNTSGKLHNGNPYDKVILNGKPEHLAIVDKPRYENAMIAVNVLDKTEASNGWVTLDAQDKKQAKNMIAQAINEIKETNMFKKLFNKKETEMDVDTLKSIFSECIKEELKALNEAEKEEEEKKKLEEAENKCKNEDVDKRDIIRQIMAIAGKEEASEDVKTIAKLAEKLAYDKSEAGKADNEKKAKCEDDEKEKEEKEEKEKKDVENAKAKNSIESIGTKQQLKSNYITPKERIELGNVLFG